MPTYNPNDWTISGTSPVVAVNRLTGETFSGTMAQVNTYIAARAVDTSKGTPGTNVTALEEVRQGNVHFTRLQFAVSAALPAIAGGAALGVGKLVYTFPAGEIVLQGATINVGITQTQGNINANTPTVGLGTVIASGVVSVLSGTATFQDIVTGSAAADCTGTRTVKTLNPDLVIATAGAHTVHFNAAATWAASGDTGALLSGEIWLNWRHYS